MGTTDGQIKGAFCFNSDRDYLQYLKNLGAQYGSLPIDAAMAAYSRAVMATNPYIQNNRVKHISSFPVQYDKDQISDMLKSPDSSERGLREVSHALEWTAAPYRRIRSLYQTINTYRYYSYAPYVTAEEAKSDAFMREWRLVSKLNHKMRPEQAARQIAGQVITEGKVAYVARVAVDKSHNSVKYAFLQQLPSDWIKIIGFNNVSKYTVSFNMMYFMQPGTDWRQFGDLFFELIAEFDRALVPESGAGKKYIQMKNALTAPNGERFYIDIEAAKGFKSQPLIYNQNGVWAYWVTLPAEKVWVFEADDTTVTAAPPFSGLFLAMDQMAALEEIQLALVQNPLVSVALGEIPYRKENLTSSDDPYQLSADGRTLFLSLWYEMLAQANTSGIGIYFAPVENLHLETLSEAPNATNISTAGYRYAMEKSGLSGLIPITDNPRAGSASISASMEERYLMPVLKQFQNLMEAIYDSLGLNFEWRFKMLEGGFLKDGEIMQNALTAMQNGITSAIYEYLAVMGKDIPEAVSQANAVLASGMMDMLSPLETSYTKSGETEGRPKVAIEDILDGEGSDGQEESLDAGN